MTSGLLLTPSEIKLVKVSIPLSDVNDELPVLKNQPFPYNAAIPEEPDEGHLVYALLAQDPDVGSDLQYIMDETASKSHIENMRTTFLCTY